MQGTAQVTVAVVFYNEEENLPKLLDSIETEFSIENDIRFDFLFVNNNSSDNSLPLLETWMAQHTDYNVQVVNRTENHLAKARTQCLEFCKTPWLVFVDADSTFNERWSKNIQIILQDVEPEVVAIGGGSEYVGTESWHSYAKSLARYFPMGKKQSQRVQVSHVPTNNYLLKTEAGLAVGGFEPYFDRVGEDLEFNVRLGREGKILYDPLFSVRHGLPKTVEQWYRKMALYGRAQSYVFSRHLGSIPMEKFIPLLLCVLLNLVLLIYPLVGFVGSVVALLIPRTRFFFLTFLFYGLGEAIGFVKYIFRQTSLESSASRKSKVQ